MEEHKVVDERRGRPRLPEGSMRGRYCCKQTISSYLGEVVGTIENHLVFSGLAVELKKKEGGDVGEYDLLHGSVIMALEFMARALPSNTSDYDDVRKELRAYMRKKIKTLSVETQEKFLPFLSLEG